MNYLKKTMKYDKLITREVRRMKYVLMHKNISVALLDLDEETGFIQKIDAVYKAAHLPYGVKVKNGIADRAALNDWWVDRTIPASRSGIVKALEVLNLSSTRMLLLRCFGLSLSDQYWIKPENSDLQWKKINFFENGFSEDVGDVLLGKTAKEGHFDFSSPDNTSDGCLKKRWKIVNGKRCLFKSGSNPFMQQPFNEVIASKVATRLGIPHVDYSIVWDNGVPYSVCEDFIDVNTELVSAWRIMQKVKKDNSTSVYRHYINCCESLGVKDITRAVDQMLVLDYIIANEDRHQNNFGLVRNADTLEWTGAAPIFDSGSSLGYDKIAGQIMSESGVECKPFKKTHAEQIKLVSSFAWIDFNALQGVENDIISVLDQAGEYIDEGRKSAIVKSVLRRIENLKKMSESSAKSVDTTECDVESDVAENYSHKINNLRSSTDNE